MTGLIPVIALSVLAAGQEPAMRAGSPDLTNMSDAERNALSTLVGLGRTSRLCGEHLPGSSGADIVALATRISEARAPASLLDQIFVSGYLAPPETTLRNDAAICAVLLREDGALVEGVVDTLDAIDARDSPTSDRIWNRTYTRGAVRLMPALERPEGWASRQVDTPVVWRTRPRPMFPSRANARAADVWLRCVVTVRSRLRACEVLHETVAGEGFGEAALESVAGARLQPATIDNTPVESVTSFWIRFWMPTNEDDRPIEANLRSAPAEGLAAEGDIAGRMSAAVELCQATGYGVDGHFGQRLVIAFERRATEAGWTAEQARASVYAGRERERDLTGITPGFSRMTRARQRQVTREALVNTRRRCHEVAAQHPGLITDLDSGDRRVETSLENLR